MFNVTWKWTGKFRTTEKNLGVAWHRIPEEVKNICDNATYQLDHNVFSLDELALRFHHRLVWIHPFSNGNGRHARLMADLLMQQHGYQSFNWGNYDDDDDDLLQQSSLRKKYIESLQAADQGNYKKLLEFGRS